MKAVRRKAPVFLALATLLLSGTLAAFPHGHPVSSHGATVGSAGRDRPCSERHFHRQETPPADDCTICFFNRLAGHGEPFEAGDHVVSFLETPLSAAVGAVPDRFLASWAEARGPPIA